MKKQKSLLSINETADLLGICSQTLRNWEKRSDFPLAVHYTLGGHRRYSVTDIDDFLDKQNNKNGGSGK